MTAASRPKPVAALFRTFRSLWRFLIPRNFQNGDGEALLYTQGWFQDAFAESCRQTASLMFPSVCPSDALPKIGADRGIPRGFAEPDASYRRRLIEWRGQLGHRGRGGAPALLQQIAAVFGGAVEAQTIDARGTRYTRAPGDDGTAVTVERGVSWNWDGEALTPNWARFWVVLKVDGSALWPSFDDGAWGETVDADDGVCLAGSGIHAGQIHAVKRIAKVGRLSWTPAGRRPIYLVLYFGGDAYPAPDGTWDEWANRPADQHAFEPLHHSLP